jgi:hypothetical protein
MSEDPLALSDDELAQLVFESQLTLQSIEATPRSLVERLRRFRAFYEALSDKPTGPALLYNENDEVKACVIRESLVVGRLQKSSRTPEGADLAFKDPEMSRRHFEVTPADDLHVVRDMGSRNGTFINGKPEPVRETILKAGDVILAGNTIFVFTGS